MYEMILRVFAFIGIFFVVFIPWLLGVIGIMTVMFQKLDGKEKKDGK